ncbi:hypothetical protein D3C87_1022720 [compost metagenome]
MLAVLIRDQHIVHQRCRQVGRNHVRGGAQQHQHEAQGQLATVGMGEAPQAEQGPGRWRRVQHLGADRAFFLLRLQRRLAAGAHFLLRFQHGLARQVAVEALDELFQHADRMQVLAQSEAPRRQAAVVVEQFQVADTGVVMVRQA